MTLPDPQSIGGDVGFHIVLEAGAPYEAINSALRGPNGIVGKAYPIGSSRTFTVSDARIYGFGNIAILQVDLTGWKKGSVYFQGQPYLNPDSYTVSAQSLDYTLETKDVFFKSVCIAFHDNLRSEMQNKARFPLASRINDARNLLQQSLNRQLKLKRYAFRANK